MADRLTAPHTMLRITRRFTAPRGKVFQAWTDPHALMQWFAPSDDYSTLLAEVDPRIGGSYRIAMKALDGMIYTRAAIRK